MSEVPGKEIDAKVARVVGSLDLAVNRGRDAGITENSPVRLYEVIPIIDPDTNEELGAIRQTRLNLRVTLLSDRYCIARITDRVTVGTTPRLKRIVTDPDDVDARSVLVQVGDPITVKPKPVDDDIPF